MARTHMPTDGTSAKQRNTTQHDQRGARIRADIDSIMSALFNLHSLVLVLLLLTCTSAYIHQIFPRILDSNKDGPLGILWKFARIGERMILVSL
ncbi:hypothetical protein HRG_009652 [Hirsutella rhossiliensis]|uniref:Protein kish n=1 Tax=Hirsutella rhossiliensis TaxID=111463 RepID=A0A9P8SE13_9HYPO|nr:uncharacterized protein HRG_09652 [Hirsutella rhossiliensis]KAH0959191.1 hypothetical protein HRG_09652 [Hirsutella rhossiliensis]